MRLEEYKIRRSTLYLIPYIAILSCFFIFVIAPYFSGNGSFDSYRFDADSEVYIALNEAYDNVALLLAINPNTLGPLLLLRLTKENLFLIFVINLSLFLLSYKVVSDTYKVNSVLFASLLMLNPLFIPAITTLNKEIFGIASIAFYLAFSKRRKLHLFFLAIMFAAFARWQMVFIIIFFHCFSIIVSNFRINRWIWLFIFVLALSVAYPIFFIDFTNVIDAQTAEQQQETAGSLITFLNYLQSKFLYVLVVIPKIFFNLFGNVFRVFGIIGSRDPYNDVYNNFFLLGHQIIMVLAVLILAVQRKLVEMNKYLFFCSIYLVVFSLGPMIQYRYIFPLYIIFAMMISTPRRFLHG